MATTRINTTLSGSGVNPKKWTFSAWIKKNTLGDGGKFFSATDGGNYYHDIKFNTSDRLVVYCHNNGNAGNLQSARLFRDPNAWYHVVVNWDTAQSDQEDRCKMWVNNERITDWHSATYPAQNVNGTINDGYVHTIGAGNTGSYGDYFNGCMSHIHFAGNQSYDPTTFGEVDSTDNMWKIKPSPSVTYTENGFFLKMEDTSNLDLDSSGQSRSFTTTGTLTATNDCPDNNFCTGNVLDNYFQDATYTNGNNSINFATAGVHTFATGTLGVETGKYYWEVKPTSGTIGEMTIGITGRYCTANSNVLGQQTDEFSIKGSDGKIRGGGNWSGGTTYAASYTTNDILGFALDATNNKLYVSKNGEWADGSGAWDSTTFDASVGAYTIGAADTTTTGVWLPAFGSWDNTAAYAVDVNFGNGYFGTTAITTNSGAGYQGAEGASKFNYQPPTNFTALNTKGINT